MRLVNLISKSFLISVLGLLNGCINPAQHFDDVAEKFKLNHQLILGKEFQHRIYYQAQFNAEVLHVYLDGDGTPWDHQYPSDDPTPRQPLILELLAQDQQPAILLGRPCYYGLYGQSICQPKYWTSARYSPEIIESLTVALHNWLKLHPVKKVVLIGYSGGGNIAVLLAKRFSEVKTVVTIAANLDVKLWTQGHHFQPLSESLDANAESPLPASIQQWHFAGGQDEIVPAAVIESFVKRQPQAHYQRIAEFDHHCCWTQRWSQWLANF
ncbi:MAG: hypothetical protein RL637_856 [Pseudomonadota bacterium]|jgi:pimeloyl-ACP methyl ester carboxylesterase